MRSHHIFFPSNVTGYSKATVLFDAVQSTTLYIKSIRFADCIPHTDERNVYEFPMQIHFRFAHGVYLSSNQYNHSQMDTTSTALKSSYTYGIDVYTIPLYDSEKHYSTTVDVDYSAVMKSAASTIWGMYHCHMERNDPLVVDAMVSSHVDMEVWMTSFNGRVLLNLPVIEVVLESE